MIVGLSGQALGTMHPLPEILVLFRKLDVRWEEVSSENTEECVDG